MAEIKAKARAGNVKAKKQPAVEILDVSEQEREKGKFVAAYQARKAAEQAQKEQAEEVKRPVVYRPPVEVENVESFKSEKKSVKADDDDDDRDDPFDSDVTSEEDDDDLMPEREDPEPADKASLALIQEELDA